MTEEELKKYRRKLADPEYMAKAIDRLADKAAEEYYAERISGYSLPKFHKEGKKGVIRQDD